jgi:hypothetical protein
MEVEEWGAPMRVVPLEAILKEIEPPETVYSTASSGTEKISKITSNFLKLTKI